MMIFLGLFGKTNTFGDTQPHMQPLLLPLGLCIDTPQPPWPTIDSELDGQIQTNRHESPNAVSLD